MQTIRQKQALENQTMCCLDLLKKSENCAKHNSSQPRVQMKRAFVVMATVAMQHRCLDLDLAVPLHLHEALLLTRNCRGGRNMQAAAMSLNFFMFLFKLL